MDTAAKPGTLQMIADFSNAKAPSGFEEETIAAARKHIGCGYETEEDCLRNFYMYRKANTGKKPVFMLDAHSDEVGFMVHSIRPNGTLRFVALGGWNVSALPSTKVLVRNKHGQYIPRHHRRQTGTLYDGSGKSILRIRKFPPSPSISALWTRRTRSRTSESGSASPSFPM